MNEQMSEQFGSTTSGSLTSRLSSSLRTAVSSWRFMDSDSALSRAKCRFVSKAARRPPSAKSKASIMAQFSAHKPVNYHQAKRQSRSEISLNVSTMIKREGGLRGGPHCLSGQFPSRALRFFELMLPAQC